MKNKFRSLMIAGVFAVGVTAVGTAAVAAFSGPHPRNTTVQDAVQTQTGNIDEAQQGQTGVEQAGESVNGNTDEKDAGNVDDGQKGQNGVNQTGESVNDNIDQKDAGNHDDAQQGQSGGQ
jgi:hypothetical protein